MRKSEDHVAAVVEILAQRHPLFARATIERWVATVFAAYSSAPVQTYVPILAQREIDALLHDLETDVPAPAPAPAPAPRASGGNGRIRGPDEPSSATSAKRVGTP